MSTREKDLPGIPTNGGRFAGPQHPDTDLPSLAAVSVQESSTTQMVGKYGSWEVPAKSLEIATAVEAALAGVPHWQRTDKAEEWAEANGYEFTMEDFYPAADNAHGHGVVLVDEDGASIGLSGHGQRNFSVDLDGGSGGLEGDEEDNRIAPTVFIYHDS